MTALFATFLPPFLLVAFFSGLILLTQRWHGARSVDDQTGAQKIHAGAVPRIGGLAIYVGLGIWMSFLEGGHAELLHVLWWAGLPAFSIGLLEDLTRKVSVQLRLFATMISGGVAWWLSGISLTYLNVWGLDLLLAVPLVSVLFTMFAVAGVANSFNIIDGLHGLSAGVAILVLVGFAAVAQTVGDTALALLSLQLIALALGFFLWNYPFGKLFLGDGGAYFLGFAIAWVAVLLPMRNPQLSPWISLAIAAYPVYETVFSMRRRRMRGHDMGHPDRLHLHSLVFTRLVPQLFPHAPRALRNAIATPIVLLFASLPLWAAIQLAEQHFWLVIFVLLYGGAYSVFYARLVCFHWCMPIRIAKPVVLK